MELNYDWKNFQSFFYVKRRLVQNDSEQNSPIYLVVDKKVIISAYSEDGGDFSDWVGATCDELIEEFPNREVILYDREKVDQSIESGSQLTHFYDQIQYFRAELKPQLLSKSRFKNSELVLQNHFLLQILKCWWQQILPSTYGIYICIVSDNSPSKAVATLLLVVQRGRISSFYVPDLNGMVQERKQYLGDVIKHLSSKYLIPIQGIAVSQSEWAAWSDSPNPWPKIRASLKSDRNKLTPFRWSIFALINLKGRFGV
jgi:hypothetical protein